MIRSVQLRWRAAVGWELVHQSSSSPQRPQLLLVFGGRDAIAEQGAIEELLARFPEAQLAGCSTAGDILGIEVSDEGLTATALEFDSTRVLVAAESAPDSGASRAAGERLAARLAAPDLVHLLVLSEGVHVNGSELVRGLEAGLPPGVAVTGGLAGDADRFERTSVRWGSHVSAAGLVGIGLYGDRLRVGHGSLGGWDPFGPERRITRSEGNVLYEMDGRPALDLYRLYLGDHARGLPATGLLFPLSLRPEGGGPGIVRTILAVDEVRRSLIFAGDVPEGQLARLMKANFDRLIDGAIGAAGRALENLGARPPEFALLISCIGRKMILRQRIEEEVEGVREVLGAECPLGGFYSYGEISPLSPGPTCELHNQTMTITTLSEA